MKKAIEQEIVSYMKSIIREWVKKKKKKKKRNKNSENREKVGNVDQTWRLDFLISSSPNYAIVNLDSLSFRVHAQCRRYFPFPKLCIPTADLKTSSVASLTLPQKYAQQATAREAPANRSTRLSRHGRLLVLSHATSATSHIRGILSTKHTSLPTTINIANVSKISNSSLVTQMQRKRLGAQSAKQTQRLG